MVYIEVGVFAVKMHFLDREKLGVLSECITKILLPMLIFTNTINGTTREQFLSSAVMILLALGLYIVLYFVAAVLSKLLWLDRDHKNLYRACTMFGNCGFMGIPIVLALYPEQGGLYISMYTVIDQFALPVLVHMVLSHIPGVSQNIAVTISVLCALPTMSSMAMIAESQNADSDYGAGFIFVTTLFSIVTLPVVCLML